MHDGHLTYHYVTFLHNSWDNCRHYKASTHLAITMTNIEPPPYETGVLSEETTPSGFPTGYFVIKNCATGRLMDVATSSAADGTRVVLWTAKDNSLVLCEYK